MSRFLSDSYHVARKSHVCDLCGDEIAPGTRYRRCAMLTDSASIGIFIEHVECHELGNLLIEDHYDGEATYDYNKVSDWLQYDFDVIRERLSPAALKRAEAILGFDPKE